MQDISKQYGWSWQFETTLGLAAHSYAESGAHGIPPINPQQKLGGIYLHLLIAFTLQRKHDYHQREGYVFFARICQGSHATCALPYTESHCKTADQTVSETSLVTERHRDVQMWFLGKSLEHHLNSLFSGKLEMKLFNSAELSNKLRHAYLQSLAQDGTIPHAAIL